MSLSRNQLIHYLKEIDITGKTVLDVGCGPEDKWARKFVTGEPQNYITLDINKEFNPDIVFDLNYEPSIFNQSFKHWQAEKLFEGAFDVVFCLEVLEHCWNPINVLKNLYEFTEKVCYISVPFINPLHDEWDYLRFTPEWFRKVLPEVGFREFIIRERVATVGKESLLWFYKEEGMRMSKLRLKRGEGELFPLIGTFVEAYK